MSRGLLNGFQILYKALEVNDEASPEHSQDVIEQAAVRYVQRLRLYASRVSDPSIPSTFMLSLKLLKDVRSPSLHELIKQLSFLLKGSPELVHDLNYFLPPGFDIHCDAGNVNVEFVVIRDSKHSAHIEEISGELPSFAPSDLVTLRTILNDSRKTKRLVSESKGSLASAILQLLQIEVDNESDRTVPANRMCFKTLQDLSYNSGKLPPSLYINDVIRREEFPVGGGGFSDIWRGRSVSGEVVCLKILRTNITPDIEKLLRRCYKEILVWRTLRHSRILKFYGVYIISWENGVRFGLVSPWLENGCVMDYIKMHPDFDRMKAIREVVEGLQYLHRSERFAHGDIKGDNIFVKSDLTCCLGDFGLTTSAWTPAWPTKSSSTNGFGSMRWMAPELLSPKIFETQEGTRFDSDIYALGCTMLEILTGQVPWSEIEIDTQVLIEVIQGRTPNVPADISPAMSWILKHTWKFWPKHRPDIDWLKPKLEPSFRVPASVPIQSAISWFFQWILGVTSVTTKNSVTPVPAPSSSLQSNRSSPFQWNLGVTSATAKNSARTLWRSASKR